MSDMQIRSSSISPLQLSLVLTLLGVDKHSEKTTHIVHIKLKDANKTQTRKNQILFNAANNTKVQ